MTTVLLVLVLLAGCAADSQGELSVGRSAGLVEARGIAAMAGTAPYLVDVQLPVGGGLAEALEAIERINALAGGELLLPAEPGERAVAVLVNVNIGDSSVAGRTFCSETPCRVATNFRFERAQVVWEHELLHALGYVGDDPADPAHDLSGLMAANDIDGVVSEAIVAHLRRALLAGR